VKRLSRGKKLLFASLLPGLLLAGELVARLAGFPRGLIRSTAGLWAREGERDLGPFRPGHVASLVWPPELTYEVRVNLLGFRGPAPAPGPPLVLCLGDSTTFGMYVQEDETYPALLPAALRARGVEAQALNAGCPRWTITDEREQLQAALPRLRPRAVVLLFCGNDLNELGLAPARERALDGQGKPRLLERLALPEAFLWLGLEGGRAWKRLRGRWPEPLRADQGVTAERDLALWQRWAAELAHARALCAAEGARLLVAAFPAYLEVETAEPCHVEQVLPGLVRQAGAEWLDLYPAFRAAHRAGQGDVFLLPQDAHASRAGNELIAREVAAALARGW
jgi:lysophospholipase L1-like esterase